MASYGQPRPLQAAQPSSAHAAGYVLQAAAAPSSSAPAGTFSPGTKIHVGSHRVVIQRYLSEGGFAHVYLVKLPKPVDGTDQAVLKRVAVPDKEALQSMRIEVETMKRLKGHKPIVTYIDSHASELKGGGYEVFLLMEYCNGGGLIDFMNTRLQHRLTEPEILDIFADIAEGVACMHYLKPSLLHRDLKVENVLITTRGSSKRFKLCDFGSASAPRPAPTSVVECRLMDDDVQKHTTLQYRSPEMVDVYRKQPMNEKSDIWALGVLLYKLCYYTTPFEDQGQLAILNASYKFPHHPVFSDRLKKLIASMLKENMQVRPTIYQALQEACAMQGRAVPIKDIYAGRAQSALPKTPRASPNDMKQQSPVVGAVFAREVEEKPVVPAIVPMRRGRPMASAAVSKSPQPPNAELKTEGDPFAALDSRTNRQSELVDDLSARFPSLGHFSLLHDQGTKFDFEASSKDPRPQQPAGLKQRVTDRLADEAFASYNDPSEPASRGSPLLPITSPPLVDRNLSNISSASSISEVSRMQSIISANPEFKATPSSTGYNYVSTGTMTGDVPNRSKTVNSGVGQTSHARSSSLSRMADHPIEQRRSAEPKMSSLQPPPMNGRNASAPRQSTMDELPEVELPASASRSRSTANRTRPASTTYESGTWNYLRGNKPTSRPESRPAQSISRDLSRLSPLPARNSLKNAGDAEVEGEEPPPHAAQVEARKWKTERLDDSPRRNPSNSRTSGLAGSFGGALNRFEGNAPSALAHSSRTPSPVKNIVPREQDLNGGSQASRGERDDNFTQEDEDNLSPEMRRDRERLRLLEEEDRVEKAQAEYRKRVVDGSSATGPAALQRSTGGVPRALSIQNRVQSLMSEEQHTPVQKTAQGYGKYSDAATTSTKTDKALPQIPRKPVSVARLRGQPPPKVTAPASPGGRSDVVPASAPPMMASKPSGRPPAPKKPMHLNSIPTGGRATSPAKPSPRPPSKQLVAMDLPGQPALNMSAEEKEDYLQSFSKRFPSLSAMELVEHDDSGRATASSGQ